MMRLDAHYKAEQKTRPQSLVESKTYTILLVRIELTTLTLGSVEALLLRHNGVALRNNNMILSAKGPTHLPSLNSFSYRNAKYLTYETFSSTLTILAALGLHTYHVGILRLQFRACLHIQTYPLQPSFHISNHLVFRIYHDPMTDSIERDILQFRYHCP